MRNILFVTSCIAMSLAAGCTSSDSTRLTGPSPVVAETPTAADAVVPSPLVLTPKPPLAGVWTGMLDVSSCVGTGEWCAIKGAESFTLRLDGENRGVAEMQPMRGSPIAIDLVQSGGADGTTIFQGVSNIPSQLRVDVEFQLVASSVGVTGSVRYTISGPRPSGSGSATRAGSILFLREVNVVRAGVLQGTWRGYLTRTACSGDCHFGQYPEILLHISQVGSQLTASLNYVQVEGTASDRNFSLTRNLNLTDCRAQYDQVTPCTDAVVFTGSVNAFDQMRGTIQRRQSGVEWSTGRYSFTATYELIGVVRQSTLDSR